MFIISHSLHWVQNFRCCPTDCYLIKWRMNETRQNKLKHTRAKQQNVYNACNFEYTNGWQCGYSNSIQLFVLYQAIYHRKASILWKWIKFISCGINKYYRENRKSFQMRKKKWIKIHTIFNMDNGLCWINHKIFCFVGLQGICVTWSKWHGWLSIRYLIFSMHYVIN